MSHITIELDALKLIPENEARAYSMAVIQKVGKKLQIAVINPDKNGVKEVLENLRRQKYEAQLFLASPSGVNRAIDKYKEIPRFEEITAGVINVSKQKLESYAKQLKSVSDLKSILDTSVASKETKKASSTLELVLAGALKVEASDIHMEPEEASVKIRLRLDGVLQELTNISLGLHKLLLSRIKLISEIKLNVRDRPQDGRFTIKTESVDIEVRTSTLPGPNGESVVMRLLLPNTIAIKLEDLGIQPELHKILEHELTRPHGMLLTTGPTGSGKTTTLYAFLKKLASVQTKTITIEDPIEYHLPNITQTQVNREKEYTFSNGLRSILRQDPDIIMVGEIRDLETAEIAMHAALTGHLVFSTLHTNNAAGTIPRLIDLGVQPHVIAPATNVAMAQRLVRKLCEKCKKETDPSPEEKKVIIENFKSFPAAYKRALPEKIVVWKSDKCEACNLTGYKGRIGIYEAFLINDEIERLILKIPAEADIKATAIKQGMLTMYQDGVLKILDGTTSFEELNRVAAEK